MPPTRADAGADGAGRGAGGVSGGVLANLCVAALPDDATETSAEQAGRAIVLGGETGGACRGTGALQDGGTMEVTGPQDGGGDSTAKPGV